ncbi:MAG TPA: DUF2062 domain-containing protein, partial [Gammaproteobacteria bacterium]
TRLIDPLLHGEHPPEYTARGVMFGLMVALTPTVGIQMPIVFLLWIAVRRFKPEWDFNLVVGMAWTWVTNILTVPPLYYLYIVTGRILLGHWDKLRDYGTFEGRLRETLGADAGWLESFWVFAVNLVEKFGIPLFAGSLPWVLVGGWLGYRWTLEFVVSFRRVRERRRRRAAERRAARG